MMAGHVVPLDAVSVEIVEDGQAGLWVRRILPGGPIVRLGQPRPASVGPVQAVRDPDGVGGRVGPAHHLVGVVHDPSGPEEPLSVLGDQTIELILLSGSVEGDRLHPHGVAVLLGLMLLEGGAADLPGDDVPHSVPDVVRSRCPTLAGSARNTVLRRLLEGAGGHLRLSDHLGLLGGLLGGAGLEYWGLLETSLSGAGLELLLLWWRLLGLKLLLLKLLGLLRLGLEELLLLLLLLELLLLKLLWRSPLRLLWSGVPTKEIVKGACDPTKESILGIGQR